jgi:DNA-binding response OmpR family regulator
MSAGGVLIVDDSLTVRMDLAEAFTEAGFLALPCATIGEARATLARQAVAVAVLDVQLPDGDGVDLLKELRAGAGGRDLVVLMLSHEAEIKDRVRGLATGADEYVGKPYENAYIVAKANDLLRARRPGSPQAPAILVIDDSATYRETLGEALAAAGYTVISAATGEAGLTMAADRRPQAVMVDGMLPGIDGATVIRRLRLDNALRGLPCILLTAADDERAELTALDAGADAFVRKEEALDVILARLVAVLRRAEGRLAGSARSMLGPKKILAVDDSSTYLHELAGELRGEGYDVVLARAGEDAIDLLRVQAVDCILLDLVMPGLGGTETCRQLKTTPGVRDIPLVMLTAHDDRAAMIAGLGAGADDYIAKASDFQVLKARVRAQIRRKEFEDENRRIRDELVRRELETAEARAAQELAEARAVLVRELERKNRELEAFSYSVSHDLRAPLRGINGISKILLEDYQGSLDATAQDYLKRICAAAKRMSEIIDDMLHLARVGQTVLAITRIDFTALVREVLAELQHRDPGRVVALRIADGMALDADPGLIRIVLDNLLGNAWKFSGRNPAAAITVDCDAAATGGPVFRIRDNGAGFDMAHAEKLFTPFRRLHTANEFPGTGIGLATVHRIIERHGGRIWAESAKGEGACFLFTLAHA